MKLNESKASQTWNLFRQLSQIPRPSGQCQGVAQWLTGLARRHHFTWRQDEVGNVLIEVPASPGRQSNPPVVLQTHMDMVCQKTPDSSHDFDKDPIELIETGGWIGANQTTLGADNGIGLCLSLACALDPQVGHPPLELLFTIDEETGLNGAVALRDNFIKARRLINLDSEDDSTICVGCAGGEQTDITLPCRRESVDGPHNTLEIALSGLTGGHSGVDIHRQRANALSVMGLTLCFLSRTGLPDFRLVAFNGGSAHNAIARDCQATILCPAGHTDRLLEELNSLQAHWQALFSQTDPNLVLTVRHLDRNPAVLPPITRIDQANLIQMLSGLPHGVFRRDNQLPMVETSSNLAIARLNPDHFYLLTSQRSSIAFCLDQITTRITSIATLAGARATSANRYPGWQPDLASPLLKQASQVFTGSFPAGPELIAIHAGLECGIIGEKIPGMEMISLGPNIEGAHSPTERVEIASVDKIWTFLTALLDRL